LELLISMPETIEAVPRERSFKNWSKHQAAQIGSVLTRLCGTRSDDSLAIFTYHRITPRIPGVPAPTINVAPDRFREQIAGLQQRGYVIRPLAEIVRIQRLGLPMPPRTVVLTIDDGFASVYKNALPILTELRAPATMFLCTAFLDTESPFPFDPWAKTYRERIPVDSWRPLRSDECREMLASGLIDFGVHTHTHQDFRTRPRELADDLRNCQRILGEKFGSAQLGFAFPYGYYNDALMDVVRGADLTCALTVDDCLVRDRSDPFGWARFTAHDWDTSATLAAKREGWYTWLLDRYQGCRQLARRLARRPHELPPRMQPSRRTSPTQTCLP
jgi:peptidoglycan/xylan/chitin deacetylase (PgdA/CDA1 family)